MLTWTLLSFVMKIELFAKWTKRVYLPFFLMIFFYEYLINIQFLFTEIKGVFEDIPRVKEYTGG